MHEGGKFGRGECALHDTKHYISWSRCHSLCREDVGRWTMLGQIPRVQFQPCREIIVPLAQLCLDRLDEWDITRPPRSPIVQPHDDFLYNLAELPQSCQWGAYLDELAVVCRGVRLLQRVDHHIQRGSLEMGYPHIIVLRIVDWVREAQTRPTDHSRRDVLPCVERRGSAQGEGYNLVSSATHVSLYPM